MTCITAKRIGLAAAAAALALTGAPQPAAAQVRALLPTIDEVAPLAPLPIDGVWNIREINERIVIVNGHAYAEDGWVHMLLFQIEPEQVVIRNIRERGDGSFIAEDLPLMSNVTFEWIGAGTLRGQTDGLIPATYHLERVSGGYPGDDWGRPGDDFPPIGAPPLPGPPPAPVEDDDDNYVAPW